MILQPFHRDADVDGKVRELAKGRESLIAALEIQRDEEMHCRGVAVDQSEGDEITPRLQQDGFLRLDVEIPLLVRQWDIDIDGFVQDIDEFFSSSLRSALDLEPLNIIFIGI